MYLTAKAYFEKHLFQTPNKHGATLTGRRRGAGRPWEEGPGASPERVALVPELLSQVPGGGSTPKQPPGLH